MWLDNVFTGEKGVRKWTFLGYVTVVPAISYWLLYWPIKQFITIFRGNKKIDPVLSASNQNAVTRKKNGLPPQPASQDNHFVVTTVPPEKLTAAEKAALPAPAYYFVKEKTGKPWRLFFINISGGGQQGNTRGGNKYFEPKDLAAIEELNIILLDTLEQVTPEISEKINQILEQQTRKNKLLNIFYEFTDSETRFRSQMKALIKIADTNRSEKPLEAKFYLTPYHQLCNNPFPSSKVLFRALQKHQSLPAQIACFTSIMTTGMASLHFQKSITAIQAATIQYKNCQQWFITHPLDKQKTPIDSYLIAPIQRLGRYGLLLRDTIQMIEELFPKQNLASHLITLQQEIVAKTQQINQEEQKPQDALVKYLFREVQKAIRTHSPPTADNSPIILYVIDFIITLSDRNPDDTLKADQGALKLWNDLCHSHSLEFSISPRVEEHALLKKSCKQAMEKPTLKHILDSHLSNLADTYKKNKHTQATNFLHTFQKTFFSYLLREQATTNTRNVKQQYQIVIYQLYLNAYIQDERIPLKRRKKHSSSNPSYLQWLGKDIIRGLEEELIKNRGQQGIIITRQSELSTLKEYTQNCIFYHLGEKCKKQPELLLTLLRQPNYLLKQFENQTKVTLAQHQAQVMALQTEINRLHHAYLAESKSYFQRALNMLCKITRSETSESRMIKAQVTLQEMQKPIEKIKENFHLLTKATHQCIEKMGLFGNAQLTQVWYKSLHTNSTRPLQKAPRTPLYQVVLEQLAKEKNQPTKNASTLSSFSIFTAAAPPPLLSQRKKQEAGLNPTP